MSGQVSPTPAEEEVMAEVLRRARAVVESDGKAAIAAAVMRGDEVIAYGVNEVHLKHDPTRHAEIVAISAAAAKLGKPDLSGCTLLSSLQPCEMCLSAMQFSGIRRVIFAAQQDEVAPKYFMFPEMDIAAFRAAAKDPFDWCGGLGSDKVIDLYEDGDA